MVEAIAKRYVKSLVKTLDKKALESVYEQLNKISNAFAHKKFKDIVLSPEVSKAKIEEFLLSMVELKDKKFENFLKLLVQNNRVASIPEITKELKKELSILNNKFEGVLISNFKVEKKEIEDIQKQLSKKLGSDIKLENKVTDYPGLKVEIDDLGVEVGLSVDRLKSQLAKHILEAI